MAYRHYRGNLRGSAPPALAHGGNAHCGENRNTSGLPYHTVCPEPNTVLSLDPNTRVFFFFFASRELELDYEDSSSIFHLLNACHYSVLIYILYPILLLFVFFLYKYKNIVLRIYTDIMLMMKCTVITPWPVWLGAAPCLFGTLSKPSYSCLYLYLTTCTALYIDIASWSHWSIPSNSRTGRGPRQASSKQGTEAYSHPVFSVSHGYRCQLSCLLFGAQPFYLLFTPVYKYTVRNEALLVIHGVALVSLVLIDTGLHRSNDALMFHARQRLHQCLYRLCQPPVY